MEELNFEEHKYEEHSVKTEEQQSIDETNVSLSAEQFSISRDRRELPPTAPNLEDKITLMSQAKMAKIEVDKAIGKLTFKEQLAYSMLEPGKDGALSNQQLKFIKEHCDLKTYLRACEYNKALENLSQPPVRNLDGINKRDLRRENPETKLTEREITTVNRFEQALEKGDLKTMQSLLTDLSKTPDSIRRVMEAIKANIEKDPSTRARWETGTDFNGNTFIRLHVEQRQQLGRGGSVEATISSDGKHTAQAHTVRFGEVQTNRVDPATALKEMFDKTFKKVPDIFERTYKYKLNG